MQLLEVKNDIAKILYTPSEKQLLLADFVLIEDINQSLICQIIGIESASNDNMNIATVRLSLSISKNSNLTTYNGYIPSKDSNVIYISPQEIAQLIKSSKTNLYWGKLSSHSDVPIYLGLNFLRDKAYIRCDSIDNSVLLNSNIIYNLQFNKKRTVVFDSEGTFRQIAPVSMLTLGKDFKLPLNIQAFEFISSNDLEECSLESKAFIQGILIELEEYARSLEDKFIPFSLFKKVVDEQARFSSIPELMILRNKILRYEQACIFAETASQFKIFGDYLSKSTITTVDVSGVDEKYHKLVIKTLTSEINKKCYLIFNANDINSDKNTISQIYDNTNIRPVITTGYDYKFSNLLKSYCKNMVLFSPNEKIKEDDVYSVFLQKLRQKEFIIYGENTFYMPLVLRLEQFDKNVFETLSDYEVKDDSENVISRAGHGIKSEKTIIEIPEQKSEKRIYNALAPKTEHPKQEFGDIITQEIELANNFSPAIVDDNPDEYIHDAILQIPDEDFIPEELLEGVSTEENPVEQKPSPEPEISLVEPFSDKVDELKTEELPLVSEELSEIKDEITLIEEPKAEELPEIKDEITLVEEPKVEELPEVIDEITLVEEPKAEELPEIKDEITLVEEPKVSEELPEIKEEITLIEEPRVAEELPEISLSDDSDPLSIIEEKIENEMASEPEIQAFVSEPAVSGETENDDITDDDLDFLDECEISDVEDTIEEEIPSEPSDDNTLFEAYIEDEKSSAQPETVEEKDDKQTYKIQKTAYKARNDLKNMLDIPEISSDKYNFVEAADSLFGQAETISFEKDEPDAKTVDTLPVAEPEEEVSGNPVIVDEKPDNTLIIDNIEEDDLAFLDEMVNDSSQEEIEPEVNDENKNKLVEAIDEFKIDDSSEQEPELKQETTQVQISNETPIKHDDVEVHISSDSEDSDELYVNSRINTDENPIAIDQKNDNSEIVEILNDDAPVSIDNMSNAEVSLDINSINESMELATGLSAEPEPEVVPIEFIGLTDDDISVLDSTNSEVLQISEEDKNVDIYELEAASVQEEVDADGLLEDFIEVPENYEEKAAAEEEKTEEKEPKTDVPPEKPVVVVQEDEEEEETPVIITQEEVIAPPADETEETKEETDAEAAHNAINSMLSEAVIQNLHVNTLEDEVRSVELPPEEEEQEEVKSDEETPSIEDTFSNEDEEEDTLFADFSIDETPQVRKDKININEEHIKANETPKVSQERRRTVEQSRQIPTPKTQTKTESEKPQEIRQDIPVYAANTNPQPKNSEEGLNYAVGDWVFHPKYGRGQVESFAHYSNKILFCTILFDNFGRRTLDARLTGLEKVK